MDERAAEQLRIVTETIRVVMGWEPCGAWTQVTGRELPVVCALLPGHEGAHVMGSWSW